MKSDDFGCKLVIKKAGGDDVSYEIIILSFQNHRQFIPKSSPAI